MDYNTHFRNILLESMAQNTHLQFENFVVGSAKNISSVPKSLWMWWLVRWCFALSTASRLS
ncbi:Methyltransferase-like 7A-like [Crotalus adamanteus]|uniref:Methyltransferase-like 7A-like n=1 Tax=Crotalus adamanteus TaxID=8729 RepID=A0AAW1BYP3_CROAD